MGSLIAKAQSGSERALSLSVNRDNPARRLYARLGFEVEREEADTYTMLLDLS